MSVSLSVRPEAEQAVIAEARRRGVSPQDLLDAILENHLNLSPRQEQTTEQDIAVQIATIQDMP